MIQDTMQPDDDDDYTEELERSKRSEDLCVAMMVNEMGKDIGPGVSCADRNPKGRLVSVSAAPHVRDLLFCTESSIACLHDASERPCPVLEFGIKPFKMHYEVQVTITVIE